MSDLREVNVGNVGSVEGKQQKKARCGDCDSGCQRKPEDKLLAEVKASGRRMLIPDKTTALLEPVDVHLGRKIVLEEDDRDQDEASHEGEAGEVVHILCSLSDVRKGIRTDEWQEHDLAECDGQAGKAENDERYRRQPM